MGYGRTVGGKSFSLSAAFVAAVAAVVGAGCGSSGSGGSTKATNIKPTRPTQMPPGGLGSYVRAGVPKGDSMSLDLTGDGRYSQSFVRQPSVIRGVWRYR